MSARRLATNLIHLGRSATAEVESAITGAQWYAGYTERHTDDRDEARLVFQSAFWNCDMGEMHPRGSEIVLCIGGAMTPLRQLPDGRIERIGLAPGEYAINPPGIWHSADVNGADGAEAIFITAGAGTEHRPRSRPG